MPDVMASIRARAAALNKTVGLPEVGDPRTIIAARKVHDQGLARIVLVGSPPVAASSASECSETLDGLLIVDPAAADTRGRCTKLLYELRKGKGLTEEQAWEQVLDPLYCAACLLRLGDLDAVVAGAAHPTATVLRPLLQIVKCPPGISTVSGCFIMQTPQKQKGVDGAFLFADCGVIPSPTVEQLADIAISTAESARLYMECEPLVAMLSFSTKGSARHPDVDKVREATLLAQRKAPDLIIEGEMQVDAALVPDIALAKFPDGRIRGRANVLIFPDLDAGNIGYKLLQRLANAQAYGPLLQGLARTGMDLSRGATPDDICGVVAVAALRAQYCNVPV